MDDQDNAVFACSDGELVALMRAQEAQMRQVLAAQLAAVAESQRRGLYSQSGARSMQVWLRDLLNIADDEAKSRVIVAGRIEERTELSGEPMPPDLPATADAVRAGEISLAHARVIVDGIATLPSSAGQAQRSEVEALLSHEATALSPRQVRVLAERIRYHLDQDGALREEAHHLDSRELHFGVSRAGMTVLKARLDRETGAKLRAALDP